MAGADGGVYESILRDLATKRNHITAILARAGQQPPGKGSAAHKDDAAIVTQAVAAVDEVLNAPDSCLTPAEKQGLLARVIEAIYPGSKESLRIYLKPPLTVSPNLNVQYFTIYATFKASVIDIRIEIIDQCILSNAA